MSFVTCCVLDCLVTVKGTRGHLHRFPNPNTEQKRFQAWTTNIGGEVATLDQNYVFNNRRICHKHFETVNSATNNRLLKTAVPTLHLPEGMSLDLPPAQEPVQNGSTRDSAVELNTSSIPSTSKDCILPGIAAEPRESGLKKNIIDSFKRKLKNILHRTQYCGICLENKENMDTIDEELEIIVNQQMYTKSIRVIIDVVLKETENILASSLICNSCTDKLIQSYLFIENAKETYKIIDDYVNELFSKSGNICKHLPDTHGGSNVAIVLESNILNFPKEKGRKYIIKDDLNEIVDIKDEIIEVEKGIAPSIKLSKLRCVKCFLILPSYRELKLHKIDCEKEIFGCEICLKIFRNEQYLSAHYKVHSRLKCKFCQDLVHENELVDHHKTCHKDIYTSNDLQTHDTMCHPLKEEITQCMMCLKNFTEEDLRFHPCKYKCPECSEIPCMHYKYLMFYRAQILNHAAKLKCLDCDYVCRRSKILLLRHVNQEHLNHRPFTCDVCRKQFYTKSILKIHIHRSHDSFVCQYCDSGFSKIKTYESHVKSCVDVKRRFACDDCPASFDSSDSLTNHTKDRHSKDVFPCGLCNKKFLEDSKRKEHMVEIHNGLQIENKVVNVECIVCQEKFDTKEELVQHMKSHVPNDTYLCRICNIEYRTLRQFSAHNRIHNGPFATCHLKEILLKNHLTTRTDSLETCETCGRSFKNITLLKYHQKVHLDSVACPKCKKMINPARLQQHWKAHLIEENPARKVIKQQLDLKCEQCKYKTWNNALLKLHMNRRHLKRKPYVWHMYAPKT